MASITLTGSGSLGVRWGHCFGYLADLLALQGATATSNVASGSQPATRVAQIMGDLAAGTADYPDGDGFQTLVTSWQNSGNSVVGQLAIMVENILITMANGSVQLDKNTKEYAFELLVQQMNVDGTTFANCSPAVGAQTAIGTPTGNPWWAFSVLDTVGRTELYVYPETLRAIVVTDSQEGATAGAEEWRLDGVSVQSNRLSWDWLSSSYGSGCALTGTFVRGDQDWDGGSSDASQPSDNLLVNGDFRTYSTTDYPDNWVITTGAATTNVSNSTATTTYLTGGGSVRLLGDGSTLTGIAIPFSTASSTVAGAGGTPAILQSGVANNAVYCASVFYKLATASPAAGVLRVSVTDASGTIQTNDNGSNLSTTVDLTAVGDTNWHQVTLFFSLPKVLPSQVRLRIDQSTALTNAKHVYLANITAQKCQQLYPGGSYVASGAGSTDPNASSIAPDQWTFAVTNTVGALQKGIWRCFDPANMTAARGEGSPYFTPVHGYTMPTTTSGSATVANTVVV